MQKRNYYRSCLNWIRPKKALYVMRIHLLVVVMIGLCCQLQGKSYAQISVHANKINLLAFLSKVEKQSQYQFFYNNAEFKDLKPMDVNFNNSDITEVLNEISRKNNFKYTIVDRTIVLKRQMINPRPETLTFSAPKEIVIDIRGKVVDSKNNPLEGVSVKMKNGSKGSMTDSLGNFTLTDVAPNSTILFSYIGYQNIEYPISRIPAVVIMKLDEQELESVTVVAYGTKAKKDLTGSVSTLKGVDLEGSPRVGVQESLQGTVAGLQASGGDGQPGSIPTVRIRGIGSINANNSPLYVVDGVPMKSMDYSGYGTNTIAGFSSSDIESITVLKDASAASLYGSLAANGVIIITTKTGKSGKPRINFSVQQGFNKYPSELARRSKTLSTPEMLELLREGWVNAGKDLSTFYNDVIVKNAIDTTISTDWMDELTRLGKFAQYDVSVSGGNDKTRHYLSLGYVTSESVLREVDYDRMTGKLNIANKLTDKLSLDANLLFSYQKVNNLADASSFENPIYYMQRLQPWAPVRDANGDYVLQYSNSSSDINPLAHIEAVTRIGQTYNILPGLKVNYKIDKNFLFETNGSLNLNFGESTRNRPTYFTSSALTNGYGFQNNNKRSSWISTSLLKYNGSLNEIHNVDAFIGFEAQKINSKGVTAEATNFLPNTIYLDGASTPTAANSYSRSNSIASTLASVNYNYLKKYYLSLSARRDGSSTFYGSNRLYGNFYSIGISWNLDQENFIAQMKSISQLKLRASYGENGNQDIGDYAALGLYSMTQYDGDPGLVYSQINNDKLTWEKNKPLDIGIDFGLFNNRLSGTFDYFSRVTRDLLFNLPIAASNGILDYNENIGSMKNEGFEVSLSGRNIVAKRPGGFSWTSDFNFTTYKNRITKLPSPIVDIWTIKEQGRDFYQFYMAGYAGVDKATGESLWYTNSEKNQTTNKYTQAERAAQGSALPKFFGGLSNSFSYNKVSLSFMIYYNWGNKIWNNWARYSETDGNLTTNMRGRMSREIYNDHWKQPGDDAFLPKIVYGGTQSSTPSMRSSRYLYDGSYIRLRDVTLAYDLSIKSKVLSSARIYVRGSNLFTYIKDDRLYQDPEVPINGELQNKPPVPTTLVFGIDLKF